MHEQEPRSKNLHHFSTLQVDFSSIFTNKADVMRKYDNLPKKIETHLAEIWVDLPEFLHLLFPLLLFFLSLLLVLELSFLLVPFFLVPRLLLRRQVGESLRLCFLQTVHNLIDLLLHRHDLHLLRDRMGETQR